MKYDMTKGTVWKKILLFALPIMAGQLLQQLYSTVDGIVVGNFVSSQALGAVGCCATVTLIFLAVAMGMSNGSAIMIAQYFGAKREQDMRAAASTILSLVPLLGIIGMVTGVFFAHPIMTVIMGLTDEAIIEPATIYLKIYSVGLIFQFLYNATAAILRSVGDSRATLYFLLVSALTNIVLDLLFVVYFKWGVAGTAVATVFSQMACCFVSLRYMYKKYPVFNFKLKELRIIPEKLKICVKMGIPSTMQQLVLSCGFTALQRLVNSFPSETISAFTVGSRIDHYLSIPGSGVLNAVSSFTGQNIGAGNHDRVKIGLKSGIIINIICVSSLCILVYFIAPPLAGLFGVEGIILSQAVEYIRFMTFAYPIFALYVPFNGFFQGAGNPMGSMTASFTALSTKLSSAYFMALVLKIGYSSCWKCNAVGYVCALTYVIIHYLRGSWKKKSIVEGA